MAGGRSKHEKNRTVRSTNPCSPCRTIEQRPLVNDKPQNPNSIRLGLEGESRSDKLPAKAIIEVGA